MATGPDPMGLSPSPENLVTGVSAANSDCVSAGGRKEKDGVSVSCKDLSYFIRTKGAQQQLLKDVKGSFLPGRLSAIMGPSGAGKTTLLDIMAGRKGRAGKIAGEVLYAGQKVSKGSLRHYCGYVEQESALIPEFSVEQMLLYTAEMKLPPSISYKDKQQRVNDLIEKLKLDGCRKTKIGDSLRRGISGGQQKRVSVGLALISRPPVLFLDEPTSGLDSQMASELCEVLMTLSSEGFTLIATVHSPSAPAFACFNNLLILVAGSVAYSGEVEKVQTYFEKLGCSMPHHPYGFSLPDWLMEVVSSKQDICTMWSSKVEDEQLQGFSLAGVGNMPAKPSQLRAFAVMMWYRTGTRYRDLNFLGARFGEKIALGVVFAGLFWQVGTKTDLGSVHSMCGAMFFLVVMCGLSAVPLLPTLVQERALFYRERADGLYNSITFYLSKLLEEAIISVVVILLFSTALYFSLALEGSFWLFTATLYVTNFIGIAAAYAVAALAPNIEVANAAMPPYMASAAAVSGFFILGDSMSTPWQWYSATSLMKYSWSVLMRNHFQEHPAGETLYYLKDGELVNVIDFYGLDEGLLASLPACFAVLGTIWAAFALCGISALTFVSHVQK